METKIKTYDDLLKDTENTWDLEESLEELLFEADGMLEAKNEGKPLTNYCWVGGRPTT